MPQTLRIIDWQAAMGPEPVLELLEAHYSEHALHQPAFRLQRHWRDQIRAALASVAGQAPRRHRFLLAVSPASQSPIGLCSAWIRQQTIVEPPLCGVISELFVRPAHRRCGTGRALAAAALDWFREEGVRHGELSTPARGSALRFWQGIGFAEEAVTMSVRLGT